MSITYTYMDQHESSGSATALMHQLVEATNLNASGLARAMQVAPSTVTRILHGEVCPSFDDMVHYAYCLGFQIEDKQVTRLVHLRGYRSPKEIGDLVNSELEGGLDSEKLDVILRYIPKTVMDWQELSPEDCGKLIAQPARVKDDRFQALVEGATQYFTHRVLWQDAPKWTMRTRLKKLFVPRAAVREIGQRWYNKMHEHVSTEFVNKNILFTYDEMKVI